MADLKPREMALVALGHILFGPFILARPCGPARNCISGRKAAGAFLGTMVWVLTAVAIGKVVL
jgi:hypothetical protein